MKIFLANPVFAKDGSKHYPSLRCCGIYTSPLVAAEAGIAFGFLDGETLEIKMNPLTGKPYCPGDYEKGLLNDDIVKTVWVHYGEFREEKLNEQQTINLI